MTHAYDYLIRPATREDQPIVQELIFGVLREFNLPPDPEDTDRDLFDIESFYQARGGTFDVVMDRISGSILGTVGLSPVDRETVELRKMYLRASARGRGLGRMLLEHAMAQAKRLGFARITLETAAPLVAAIELYKRYGFIPLDVPIHTKRCDQAFELLMDSI